jgi:hypothetical protein
MLGLRDRQKECVDRCPKALGVGLAASAVQTIEGLMFAAYSASMLKSFSVDSKMLPRCNQLVELSSLLKNLKSSAFVLRYCSSYKRSVRFGSECSRLVATLSL